MTSTDYTPATLACPNACGMLLNGRDLEAHLRICRMREEPTGCFAAFAAATPPESVPQPDPSPTRPRPTPTPPSLRWCWGLSGWWMSRGPRSLRPWNC